MLDCVTLTVLLTARCIHGIILALYEFDRGTTWLLPKAFLMG